MNIWTIAKDAPIIRDAVHRGEVFAYPTEAVYGLGGDPANAATVAHIIAMKVGRSAAKGLIMVAGDWAQCTGFIAPLAEKDKAEMWALGAERATTFILPAGEKVAAQLCDAKTHRVALRISRHPIVRGLCAIVGQPLVSTSANFSAQPAARSIAEVRQYFPDIPLVEGALGGAASPSRIIDWTNKKVLRD